MQVEAVELFTNLKEEDSENKDRNQEIECNAQLDHHRHSVGGTGCSQEEAVFHGKKSNHLGNGLAPRDHHEEGEQNDSKSNADRMSGDGCGEEADWLGEAKREDHKHQPDEHGDRNVDQALIVLLGPQPLDQCMKNQGQGDDLEDQCERCREIELG